MKIELPFPPGVNTLYGLRAYVQNGKPRAFPYKTPEHRDYVTQAQLAVLEAGLRAEQLPVFPKPATVAMVVRLYRPRKAGDIDGPLKTLLDVLQGLAFENDDQVARLEVYRHDDKHRPRVELEVTELAAEEPVQAALFGAAVAVRSPQLAQERRTPPRPPPMPEPLERKLRRLARPAVVSNRSDE